jgi:hypothetical protein
MSRADDTTPHDATAGRGQALPDWPSEDYHCRSCDLHYPDIAVCDVVGAVPSFAAAITTAVTATARALGAEGLRARPAADVWSVLEYVCHLRDVYAVYTIRLYRTRTEHQPVLEPMLNDLRARRFGYNQLDLAPVLTELSLNADGLHTELGHQRDWTRSARRQAHEHRSALWLARQALHETRHHLEDIRSHSRRPSPP